MTPTKNSAADRAEKVAAARATLQSGLKSLQTGEDWKNLLTTIASSARRRLSPMRYSFGNQVIVMGTSLARGLDFSMVGTFKAWESVGRRVKKGEKAIYILQPNVWNKETKNEQGVTETHSGIYFRALPVFVLGQTEGDEIPIVPSLTQEIEDDSRFAAHVDELRSVALSLEGSPVSSVTVRPGRPGDMDGARGWYQPGDRSITVIDNGNRSMMFKTLVHEVAHSIMHGKAAHHEYAKNEVEAESVAYIVASVFGLDTANYSFPYVSHWAKGDDASKLVQSSGDRITKAVTTILDALLGKAEEASAEAA